ncbi:MAG: hypothetical protein WCO91_00335 [Gemmataceae bacterium]
MASPNNQTSKNTVEPYRTATVLVIPGGDGDRPKGLRTGKSDPTILWGGASDNQRGLRQEQAEGLYPLT